jgi:hypothetical protein
MSLSPILDTDELDDTSTAAIELENLLEGLTELVSENPSLSGKAREGLTTLLETIEELSEE